MTGQHIDYLKYTSYRSILQVRRLDFIVERVLSYYRGKDPSTVKLLEIGCGIDAVSFVRSSLGFKLAGAPLIVRTTWLAVETVRSCCRLPAQEIARRTRMAL